MRQTRWQHNRLARLAMVERRMAKHPLLIKRIAYSDARSLIRVGDGIGCRGNRPVSRLIRLFRGGAYDLSHWATVIRDIEIGASKRVQVFEFLGAGPRMSYLSTAYVRQHGAVIWMPMHCTCTQQEHMIETAAALEEAGTKYDFASTWGAILKPIIPVSIDKFNCSEGGWHMGVEAGRLKARFDRQGRPIAPVPGDMPVWCEAKEIFELVF